MTDLFFASVYPKTINACAKRVGSSLGRLSPDGRVLGVHVHDERNVVSSNEPRANRARLSLGQIVATPGALEAIESSGDQLAGFLERHVRGDWGELDDEDRIANDQAVAHEGDANRQSRVLSAYKTSHGVKIWVITEWDRSATTILLPDEY